MPPNFYRLPPEADRVLIAVNRKAGAGGGDHRVTDMARRLEAAGFFVSVETDLAALTQQAERDLVAGRLRTLVAAGGDGTIAELVNRTSVGMPIIPLPLGTENLLAKYLGLADVIQRVADAIIDGCVARFDAGSANGRIFLLHAGVGFDAHVVGELASHRSGNIRHWSYVQPIWQAIRGYKYPPLTIRYTADEANASSEAGQVEIRARWAFVFNLPKYAVGLQLAPQAVGTDGLLDLCTFRNGSFRHGLWYLYNILCNRHARLADCTTALAAKVRIEADGQTPYQLDGDAGGMLPVDIEVLPQRLTLLIRSDRMPAAMLAAAGQAADEVLK